MLRAIVEATAREAGITVDDLRGPSRVRDIAWPRQTAMLAAKALTKRSYGDIGRALGGRDHSTILFGVRAAAARIESDPDEAEFARRVHERVGA